MPLTTTLPLTRRGALAAAVAALAWRPAAAAEGWQAAEALHVLNRLAFGPAPGDLERVTRLGASAWIAEQLRPDRLALPAWLADQLSTLPSAGLTQRDLVERYRDLAKAAKAAQLQEAAASGGARAATQEGGARREQLASIAFDAAEERLLQALASPRQLQEVLVDFWFDHFNVFQGKGLVRVLAGSYEREAIRPHVLGRFRTMLGATAKHPAMLFYLDNWLSAAPGWQPPRRVGAEDGARAGGLNENYAREVMELHTLGVDGGYTQQDVTELARILTGWTLAPNREEGAARRRDGAGPGGDGDAAVPPDSIFRFDPRRHDDGVKHWLGRTVRPGGQQEGEDALDVLARHPATARHIAFKLARRFVADAPAPALVDRLARRFLATDGDLRAVMQALVDSLEFRDPRVPKFKSPYEYVVSAVRASGVVTSNVKALVGVVSQLGQPLHGCQTPDGWHDTEADWLNPSAIAQRVNFATALASGRLPLQRADVAGVPVDAGVLLETLGPSIGDRTRATVAASAPALRAALVLGSPDFMRR